MGGGAFGPLSTLTIEGFIVAITGIVTQSDGKKYRIVEQPVDAPNSVRRFLVPADTTDEETPVGSRLLDERETDGQLARQASPDVIRRGDPVRLKTDTLKIGTVVALLKSGKVTVKWDGGLQDRYESIELMKIY